MWKRASPFTTTLCNLQHHHHRHHHHHQQHQHPQRGRFELLVEWWNSPISLNLESDCKDTHVQCAHVCHTYYILHITYCIHIVWEGGKKCPFSRPLLLSRVGGLLKELFSATLPKINLKNEETSQWFVIIIQIIHLLRDAKKRENDAFADIPPPENTNEKAKRAKIRRKNILEAARSWPTYQDPNLYSQYFQKLKVGYFCG